MTEPEKQKIINPLFDRFGVDFRPEVLAHVSPARWNPLLRLNSTVVEGVTRVDGTRFCYPAQFLGMMVPGGKASAEQCERFGKAIDKLLEQRLVVGVLMEPGEMRLARFEPRLCASALYSKDPVTPETHPEAFTDHGERSVLLCYLHSPMSKDELNTVLGFKGFVDEGGIPESW